MTYVLATCPTPSELQQMESDFDIVFDPAANLPVYACQGGMDPGGGVNPRLAVYQVLRAVSALVFDEPLPWTDLPLYDWLRNAVTGIVFSTTSVSYCCDEQGRMVLRSELLSQNSMAVWHDPQTGIGLESLAGLIVHEARHAETGGHTCGDDDQTLSELGAWGAQYYFFVWLADHTSVAQLDQAQRQGVLDHAATALTRICNP